MKVGVLQESDAFTLGSRFYIWQNNGLGSAPAQSLCFYPQLQSEHELTASPHKRTAYAVVVACELALGCYLQHLCVTIQHDYLDIALHVHAQCSLAVTCL